MTNTKTDWWSEAGGFFGPDYLTEYDGRLTEEITRKEIAFINNVFDLQSIKTVLDVPCGHGRHALLLAAQENTALSITGYELNSFFLRKAEADQQNKRNHVRFVQGDMRELPFDEEFDLALNLFTAMGYFDSDIEDEKFFAGVYRALKPGGKFMVDFINQSWLIKNYLAKQWVKLPNGNDLLIEREFDYRQGYSNDRRTLITTDGRVTKHFIRHRVYAPHELIAMAKRVGLSFVADYGDFDENKSLDLDCKRMILVFEKPSS